MQLSNSNEVIEVNNKQNFSSSRPVNFISKIKKISRRPFPSENCQAHLKYKFKVNSCWRPLAKRNKRNKKGTANSRPLCKISPRDFWFEPVGNNNKEEEEEKDEKGKLS